MRIGVLGGSFDPIHLAHLIIADSAQVSLGLDTVLFVPAAQQPLKAGKKVTDVTHRLEMVRLAIENNPRFALSTVDAERLGPSYSVDMLADLHQEWAAHDPQFWFIMGVDSLSMLPLWHDPMRLVSLARLAVCKRPGPRENLDIGEVEAKLPGISSKIDWVDAPLLEISATDIRRRVAADVSIRYLVPDSVRSYIEDHKLYRGDHRGAT